MGAGVLVLDDGKFIMNAGTISENRDLTNSGGGGVGAVTLNATYSSESGGAGGAGTSGTDGAPGCVLIYYRLPKALSASGAVHDKNGKIISDKYGRRLVV